jgi:hypothetical protein
MTRAFMRMLDTHFLIPHFLPDAALAGGWVKPG